MASILQEFRQSQDPFVLSFNWVDAVTGLGYIQYYGGQTADSSGTNYILQAQAFDPWHVLRADNGDEDNSGRYNIYTLGTSDASVADLDFDTGTFEITRKMVGTCTFNVPFGFDPGVSTDRFSLYIIGTVYRVRGGSETSVGTGTSSTLNNANDGVGVADGLVSWSFDLTETNFKPGDLLRVNLNIHAWRSSGSGSCSIIIMTDPYARDVAATGGSSSNDEITYSGGRPLSFYLPFKVQ